jgi:hypothetical protein
MEQLGVFDADKRLVALSAKGDPLEAIDRLVPWESFRAEIEAVVRVRRVPTTCVASLGKSGMIGATHLIRKR